jgi:hypothetical protein
VVLLNNCNCNCRVCVFYGVHNHRGIEFK